jgi:hypothetical protein
MTKPILCLDFDGVLHSYTSGWKGAANIPDPPVRGMVPFLHKAIQEFDVQVFSSRTGQPGGVDAMRAWITTHVTRHYDCENHGGAPREAEMAYAILDAISFPTEKPPAMVTIDDRAIQFTGEWPSIAWLKAFKPWYKRPFGATGDFPMPAIDDSDEGALQMGVAYDEVNGLVRLDFGTSVAWLALPPPEAMELAKLLLRKAGAKTV